jgi:hypothetical protein
MTDETHDTEWRTPVGNSQVSGQLLTFDNEEEEQTSTDRVALMLGSVATDDRAKVTVQRIIGPNKYGWCDDYSVSDYESGGAKMIRQQFGPGEYDVRLYGIKPGTNRFVVLARTTLTLVKLTTEPLPVYGRENNEMVQVLKGMQEQITAVINRPAPDPMANLQQTMALMGMFKDVLGGGGNSGNSISDIMKAIREMKAVSSELNPEKADKEDESDSLIKALAPLLGVVAAGMMNKGQEGAAQAPQTALQHAPQLPAPKPAVHTSAPAIAPNAAIPLTPESSTEPAQEIDEMNLYQMGKLTILVKTVVGMGNKNAPIEVAGDLLLDELPDEILDLMENETWFADLSNYVKMIGVDLAPLQEWLTRVRTYMMPEPEPEGEGIVTPQA